VEQNSRTTRFSQAGMISSYRSLLHVLQNLTLLLTISCYFLTWIFRLKAPLLLRLSSLYLGVTTTTTRLLFTLHKYWLRRSSAWQSLLRCGRDTALTVAKICLLLLLLLHFTTLYRFKGGNISTLLSLEAQATSSVIRYYD